MCSSGRIALTGSAVVPPAETADSVLNAGRKP